MASKFRGGSGNRHPCIVGEVAGGLETPVLDEVVGLRPRGEAERDSQTQAGAGGGTVGAKQMLGAEFLHEGQFKCSNMVRVDFTVLDLAKKPVRSEALPALSRLFVARTRIGDLVT